MQTNTVWTDNNERELNKLKEKLGLPKYSDVLRYAVHFTLEKILQKSVDKSTINVATK